MVRGTFFPCLPRGVRACWDGWEHFFSTFARLTEGRGGGLKLYEQFPYRTNTFQNGAPLREAPPENLFKGNFPQQGRMGVSAIPK